MSTRLVAALALLCSCTASSILRAADIVVQPGQSIQAAIGQAVNGDRILIQPGTYFEHSITTLGKSIEVIGVAGAAATVIDGGGAQATIVRIADGEPPQTVIRGLTIRNGYTGIYLIGAAKPVIRECVIEGNKRMGAGPNVAEAGAGVYGYINTAGARLVDCVVRGNEGHGVTGPVYCTRCLIRDNQQVGYLAPSFIELVETRVLNNSWTGVSVGNLFPGQGPLIQRCDISGNGEGVFSSGDFGVAIRNCRIVGNHGPAISAQVNGSFLGGSFVLAEGCVIANNTSTTPSGAALNAFFGFLEGSRYVTLSRCTIVGNSPAAVSGNALTVEYRDSIIWSQPNLVTGTPSLTVSHCDVQGGHPGVGNFALDPQFVALALGDYHIRSTSPCINAGTNGAVSDFEGNPAVGAIDVGADEFAPQLSVTGDPAPGGTMNIGIYGVPGSAPVLFFLSLGRLDTPVATPFGSFHLVLPLVPGFPIDLGTVPSGSAITFPGVIPPNAPVGTPIHMQVFLGGLSPRLTNVESIVIG